MGNNLNHEINRLFGKILSPFQKQDAIERMLHVDLAHEYLKLQDTALFRCFLHHLPYFQLSNTPYFRECRVPLDEK